MRYLILDTEMGGRSIDYSLLTAYFMVTDENFNTLGELDLAIKPDDGNYFLSGQGMNVNGINIQAHDQVAMPYKLAKPLLYNFLNKYSSDGLNKIRLTPVGHGTKGDISHIIKNLISEGSWEQFCTYHYIDTSVVLQFLRACGKMPMDCDGSVGALGLHFGIIKDQSRNMFNSQDDHVTGDLHTAKQDAMITAKIYKKMLELVR